MLDELEVVDPNEAFRRARRKAEEEFEYLGSGSYRSTYKVGDGLVLKIERGVWSDCNAREAEAFAKWPHLPLAPCVLVEYEGVQALLMESVDIGALRHIPFKEWPDWVSSIDGNQAGLNEAGEIICYDYGQRDDVLWIKACCEGKTREYLDGTGEYER